MRRFGLSGLVAVFLAVLACGASGQAPPPATPTAPTLSTEERLTLENSVLKIRLLQAQLDALGRDLTARVAAFENAYPGYTVNLDSLTLVLKPTPKSTPKPPQEPTR